MKFIPFILLFFTFLPKPNALQNTYDYNLPESHMPFYFRLFPEELRKCKEDDFCPYKELNSHELPCWGYESDCEKTSAFSHPECPSDPKGWASSKKEQFKIFYEQGDFGYVKNHKDSIKVMCEPTFKEDTALECSDHLQFCRGRNIMMNFTSLLKRTEPFRYKMDVFEEGDFGGYCHFHEKRLKDMADHVSPLQSWAPEMRYFRKLDKKPIADGICDIVIEKPVFVMKIDASKLCKPSFLFAFSNKSAFAVKSLNFISAVNMYHHLCDFFNLYASLHINSSHPATFSTDVHVIIWETYPYHSNFGELWKAFTINPILTLRNFIGKTVCFKNIIFPLLPRMIFGLFYNTPLISGCEKSGLFKAFSEFVLHRLKIKEYERNTTQIRVTLLSRQTMYRNILNEKELLEELSKNKKYDVRRTVYNRDLPFRDQLEITRNTDIFIGMHGAGLTHLLFLPDWAGVFELYNCEDENCYLDLARLRGLKYITWKNKKKLFQQDAGHHPEGGAHAKFTNYAFDVKEFALLVDKLAAHVNQHSEFKKKIHNVELVKHDEL